MEPTAHHNSPHGSAAMSTSTSQVHHPQLLAAGLIAIPVIFFALVALIGSPTHLAVHILLAWTVAAVVSAATFGLDHRFYAQFSTSERLAILAGNGMLGLLIAPVGYIAFGMG